MDSFKFEYKQSEIVQQKMIALEVHKSLIKDYIGLIKYTYRLLLRESLLLFLFVFVFSMFKNDFFKINISYEQNEFNDDLLKYEQSQI